jgi:hypothetical protein
VQLDLQV